MEKSFEQLKHIERLSRQNRHHRTHLNQVCESNLRSKLYRITEDREQYLLRSSARRELETERKSLLDVTIKQIARERQTDALPPIHQIPVEQTVQILTKDQVSRPSSSVQVPNNGTSCRLFSHDCQLYPCQPIYNYTSFVKKENDQTLRIRNPKKDDSQTDTSRPQWQELCTRIQEKKYEQNRRQLASSIQNQNHLVNRYVAMQRNVTKLEEQSRQLREQLTQKRSFGYVKEQRQQLSQAIKRHLEITAKFCS